MDMTNVFTLHADTLSVEPAHSPENIKAHVSLNFLDCVEAVEWWMKAGDTLSLQCSYCVFTLFAFSWNNIGF